LNDLVLECADVHKTALSAIDKLTEDVPKAEQLTGAAWASTKLKASDSMRERDVCDCVCVCVCVCVPPASISTLACVCVCVCVCARVTW
jgi:hypothetical protein